MPQKDITTTKRKAQCMSIVVSIVVLALTWFVTESVMVGCAAAIAHLSIMFSILRIKQL